MASEVLADGASPTFTDGGSPGEKKGMDEVSRSSRGSSIASSVTSSGGALGTPKTPGFMERVQARVRADEMYREEIVRSIFGDVGTPVEDFSCAVESRILLHGRMYVTHTFVCFYSNLFGFEKTIKIPFCHMRCITKEKTALFIPNAIAIITSKKEYIFRSFWDREEAFRTLKAYHQESLTQSPTHRGGSVRREMTSNSTREHHLNHGQSRRVRRGSHSGSRASDLGVDAAVRSSQSRHRVSWPGRGGGEQDRSLLNSADGGGHKQDISRTASSGSIASLQEFAQVSEVQGAAERPADGDSQQQEPQQEVEEQQQQQQPLQEANDGEGEEHGAEHRPKEHSVQREDGINESPLAAGVELIGEEGERDIRLSSEEGLDSEVDVLGVEGSPEHESTGDGTLPSKLQEFKLALVALGEGFLVDGGRVSGHPDSVNSSNAAAVRITAELPCQLQNFFELFIANDAEKGLPAFHVSQGDSDVKATPWKVAGGSLGMTREIRFVHPFTAPIGPNRTRAVKLQRCRLYDEHGLIIETSTYLEDIVMSDYFHIEDRCVVQPAGDGSIHVDVEVEIKFLKSTMFRKTIETKSLNESREVWEAFLNMAKETVRNAQPALPQPALCVGDDSADEARIRATRERLRERRKRHRSRLQQPHPARDQPTDMLPSAPTVKAHTVRPRAKSASSRMSTGPVTEGRPHVPEKNDPVVTGSGDFAPQASAVPTRGRLFSFATIPWVLLAILFLFEGVQFFRFSRETAGFLEAAEAALAVLGNREEDEEVCGSCETELRESLARGLLKVYSRNRFFWPFSTFFR